ncbi:hypothetical protein PR202_ga07047 [Eleusine coracana subsp. coracana]|uniref:DUF659 domain-containing protein n=1 Tax=Eleusine coracana subsp. coracana TaxID=191504 RepID=A0AAV5BYA5_ELECO|nr:hypothetical protein PR202_ga07047 [Eleusine coracana subsp. coracana]
MQLLSIAKCTSYTRVEAHLLQKTGKGIGKCLKVTYEMLSEMRKEVERASESLLKQERRHIETQLESTKSTWPEKGVTICSHRWSDPQRRPIINFIVVSEKAPMFLRADNCEGEYKSKKYIAEKLRAIIDEVGHQNVVQIITDNAANYKDLVFVHSNLRHLSRRTEAYKIGEIRMWDVGGDSFDSVGGIGLLEVADLSIDEPELQAISFGLGDLEIETVEENEEEA